MSAPRHGDTPMVGDMRFYADCPPGCRGHEATPAPDARQGLRERIERDLASAFIRIRGAHNPKPGEPCAWCRLAAEQAAEAVMALPESVRAALAAPAQEGLSWAVEYAIERLTDADPFPDWQQPGNVIGDLVDVLHGGLTGKPPGLSAVGARCPVCDAKRGLYDVPPEPHHD